MVGGGGRGVTEGGNGITGLRNGTQRSGWWVGAEQIDRAGCRTVWEFDEGGNKVCEGKGMEMGVQGCGVWIGVWGIGVS